MRLAPILLPVAAIVALALLSGLTPHDPYANTAPAKRRPAAPGASVDRDRAEAQTARGVPGQNLPASQPPAISSQRAAGALPSTPQQAARRGAQLQGNWTATSAAAQQRRFAAISIGQARLDAQLAAAEIPTDPQIQAGHARSTAIVASVTITGGGTVRRAIVVAHESVRAPRVHDVKWRVTLARLRRVDNGWAIESWEPQP
jgi:hypothetical protein